MGQRLLLECFIDRELNFCMDTRLASICALIALELAAHSAQHRAHPTEGAHWRTCSASRAARLSDACAVSCVRSSRHRRCSCASAVRSLAASPLPPSDATQGITYVKTR
jgi:hypothetical protein